MLHLTFESMFKSSTFAYALPCRNWSFWRTNLNIRFETQKTSLKSFESWLAILLKLGYQMNEIISVMSCSSNQMKALLYQSLPSHSVCLMNL